MTISSGGVTAPDVTRLADAIVAALREKPLFFVDFVRAHRAHPYRTMLLAWGAVRDRHKLARDSEGRYFIAPEE